MSHLRSMRKHIFVDPKVQGALVVRVMLYWMVCLFTIMLMLLCWRIVVSGPTRPPHAHLEEMWFLYGPAVIASFVLLPLVIVDIIRTSNRFAGPMLRLRRSMQQVARGEQVEPLEFRKGDFWHDFAEDFNGVARRIELEAAQSSPEDDEHEEEEPVAAGAQ